jgi:hypothetical protein
MSTILIPAATDLAGLNAILAQMEEADGPLTAMGNDGANTTLTFDDAGTKNGAKRSEGKGIQVATARCTNHPHALVVMAGLDPAT